MKTIFHKASERGFANHGWLKAAHSFSFANYFDNQKIHFGKLRVLNDDIIAPSSGFGLHPHQDMEIITIPLSGSLKHTDNMGNQEIIAAGEVQVMSAGSGIWHSEFNASSEEELTLFQIWVFTNKKGHNPRYDQKFFEVAERTGKWQMLVSPDGINDSLWIHQDAYISMIETGHAKKIQYLLNRSGNGVYFMLIDGNAEIDGQNLNKRDALGTWNFNDAVEIGFAKPSKLVAIEVPMN